MAVQQDEYESVTSPSVISSLLNTMIESGGVTLCLATPDARPEVSMSTWCEAATE